MDDAERNTDREIAVLKEYQDICAYIYRSRRKLMEEVHMEHAQKASFVYGKALPVRAASEKAAEIRSRAALPKGIIRPPYLSGEQFKTPQDRMKLIWELGLDEEQAEALFAGCEKEWNPDIRKDLIIRYYVDRKIFDRDRINEMLLLFRESALQ